MSTIGKSRERKQWLPGAGLKGEQGVATNEYKVSFWNDENILYLDIGDGCTVRHISIKKKEKQNLNGIESQRVLCGGMI